MTNTQAGLCVIKLISGVLNNKKVNLPPDTDWQQIYELARFHTVANIVYYALDYVDLLPDESITDKLSKVFKGAVLREAQQENETQKLLADFESNGICSLLLKGGIMKKYYPLPDMRQMGDIDFLIADGYIHFASEILKSNGFICTGSNEIHVGFSKPPVVNVELHTTLSENNGEFFDGVFARGVPLENNKYAMKMSADDFYIYLVAHMAKHYKTYGTGIRSITDIFVFRNHFKDSLNCEYIEKTLGSLGLLQFEQNLVYLSSVWFDGALPTKRTDDMTEYLISSGAYGAADNLEANRFLLENINRRDSGRRKLRYFIKTVFPGKHYMGIRYRIIKKCPALLPIFWIVRWIQTLFGSVSSIKYRIISVAKADKTNILEESGFKQDKNGDVSQL